jgi:hypothetical protein
LEIWNVGLNSIGKKNRGTSSIQLNILILQLTVYVFTPHQINCLSFYLLSMGRYGDENCGLFFLKKYNFCSLDILPLIIFCNLFTLQEDRPSKRVLNLLALLKCKATAMIYTVQYHRLYMKLDLQSLFGLLCTALLIG